jgi:hypothetical protein
MLLALQYSVSVFREASAAVCRVRSCTGCVTREPGGAEVPRGDAAKPGQGCVAVDHAAQRPGGRGVQEDGGIGIALAAARLRMPLLHPPPQRQPPPPKKKQ